jgi:hypothetical protein
MKSPERDWCSDCGRWTLVGERCPCQSVADQKTPLAGQVGGDWYKKMVIQPAEFCTKNNLGFLAGCVVKRVCRYRDKNGREDLEKAIHELQLLIELEYGE